MWHNDVPGNNAAWWELLPLFTLPLWSHICLEEGLSSYWLSIDRGLGSCHVFRGAACCASMSCRKRAYTKEAIYSDKLQHYSTGRGESPAPGTPPALLIQRLPLLYPSSPHHFAPCVQSAPLCTFCFLTENPSCAHVTEGKSRRRLTHLSS